MIEPKYRKTPSGYFGWFVGTTLRYAFLIRSGYLAYNLVRRRVK